MKVKTSDLGNTNLSPALAVLENTAFTGKVSYEIAKVIREIKKARGDMSKMYQDTILNEFAQKDEQGVIKPNPKDPMNFLLVEGKTDEQLQEAQKKFSESEIELDCRQLLLDYIKDAKMTPGQISALEPFMSPLASV